MDCQKYKFVLNENNIYLNGAYMSPNLKSVIKAGHKGIGLKNNPDEITAVHFFTNVQKLRKQFASLIRTKQKDRVVICPSVSYAMSNYAQNIKVSAKDEILMIDEQFPSNYYCWKKLALKNNAKLNIVKRPITLKATSKKWNEKIIKAISPRTKVISIPQVHWADGTIFDLLAISKKAKSYRAKLFIDATQSLGVFPYHQDKIKADGLVSAAYKWLLGPYAFGFAFFGSCFDHGTPIEESWINRMHSDDFKNLVNYKEHYRVGARRYEVGESSNFIGVSMMRAALKQLNKWNPADIQDYCHQITKKGISEIRDAGYWIEDDNYRAKHLFGIKLPKALKMSKVKKKLFKKNIKVSYRGDAIRVSPNVYNTKADFDQLVQALLGLVS